MHLPPSSQRDRRRVFAVGSASMGGALVTVEAISLWSRSIGIETKWYPPGMAPPEPRRITVATRPPYDLTIGPGSVRGLAAWLQGRRLASRYALLTDTTVGPLHAAPLLRRLAEAGLTCDSFAFDAGESSKTRGTKEKLEDAMIEAGLGRDSAVIALGGGVVTDLAGFLAATYHRGIPCVQVPTTLLAMVDASVGGKTGVDHPKGKNLIGAFHQPAAVFIDVDYLVSLPAREFRSGLAEIVKAGVIRDADLFRKLQADAARIAQRDPEALSGIILRACEIKAEVVSSDEREADLRKILNFGHTVGHALESLSSYAVKHGEAVAIGMVVEARMAVKAGLLAGGDAEAIGLLLQALGLPSSPTGPARGLRPEAILETMRLDKKARGGAIEYAVPDAIGSMARGPSGFGIRLDDALALEVLGA